MIFTLIVQKHFLCQWWTYNFQIHSFTKHHIYHLHRIQCELCPQSCPMWQLLLPYGLFNMYIYVYFIIFIKIASCFSILLLIFSILLSSFYQLSLFTYQFFFCTQNIDSYSVRKAPEEMSTGFLLVFCASQRETDK